MGAGISSPFIPLASEIALQCKEIAAKYDRVGEPPSNSSLDTYSYWFEKAFPHASRRQRHFKELIKGKPISHANFRLAHLLMEKGLATLVVTPNFDDFLSRALILFGQPHIICDHPNTVERIDPESDEIQIVHVHGTYWFYDGCNLRGEIKARTADSPERSATMTSLLSNIVSRRSALVIGYAGWEGDVIMTALERRLKSGLPNNLYWFCYRRSDADRLPVWLREHPNVRVVVPPEPSKRVPSNPQPASEIKLAATANEMEPTLTAQSVLDKLVEAFTKKSPALTLDPIGFFANQLTDSFPPDSSEKADEDIYKLREVIRRVRQARESEGTPTPIEAEIEHVRDAVRRSAYAEALQTAAQIESKIRSDDQRGELLESVISAALGLNDNSETELGGYDLALRLAMGNSAAHPRVRERASLALLNKGVVLGQLNRSGEAIQTYDEVLRRFGDAQEPAPRENVAKALFNKGVALGQLSYGQEAIRTYDELLRRFGNATDPSLHEPIASALYNRGLTLGQLNRGGEAIEAYDEVLRRFGEELALRKQVAKTLVNKGVTLGQLNRGEEEIQAYDEVLRRFSDAPELALREQSAKALFYKGVTLGQLNRSGEAIQTYDEVLRRFGNAPESALLSEQVAKALFNKGVTLGQLNRGEEEIQAYDEVLRRFGDAPELALREQSAKALFYKGVTLGQLNRSGEAIQTYDEVLRRFGNAPESALLREQVAKALFNKGVRLGQLDRGEEAVQIYDEVLREFGAAPEPTIRERVAKALFNKGLKLGQLNRPEESRRSFEEVVARFTDSPEPSLQQLVQDARAVLKRLDGKDENP